MIVNTQPPIPPDALDLPPGGLWLAHCKDGPMPHAAADAIRRLLLTELRPWDARWEEDFVQVMEALRTAGAAVLGVEASDISLVQCTSTGLEAVALGYPWKAGDEVLVPVGEFPSNRLPWLALEGRGVTCREVELWPGQDGSPALPPSADIAPEERLLAAIDARTRIVAVSWVRFQDGTRLDLDRLGEGCRRRGVHLVVDGIQGAGTLLPPLRHASAFATGGHKGLLGGQGQGLLWTEPAFRRMLTPLGTWLSTPEGFSQDTNQASSLDLWAADGRRLEAGSPSIMACAALTESLRLIMESGGPAVIHAHVVSLQRQLLDRLALSPAWAAEAERLGGLLERDRLGPVLAFLVDAGRTGRLTAEARARNIGASSREGYLRVALHGWHSDEDVQRCAEWLLSA